jgi:adenine-specific DNA-methyltransferase
MRAQIEQWKHTSEINENTYYFLLASLLESADKVANTASVYGAYLKKIKASAAKKLVLKPATFQRTQNSHSVYQQDSNTLIKNISGDLLYLDPPYNGRQYGANYHLLNTIANYDTFVPRGKTGLPNYYKSDYCKKNEVVEAFTQLIEDAQFQYVFLSYNNEGLMSQMEVEKVMKRFGKYSLKTTSYQRYKADKTENRNHKATETVEFLHSLEKQ